MQSNPILTALKILAFAVLAFLVGVSTCQKANLENKVTALDSSVGELSRKVGDLTRAVEAGGGTDGAGIQRPPRRPDYPDRAALDASADPSKPLGTPGRYKDYFSDDPWPEIPPEAAGHDDGEYSRWYGPEPKGFNFITENEGGLNMYVEQYCSDSPASRHRKNPSKWSPALCWRVEVSPDYREWTLFFRKDALWHPVATDLAKHPHLQGRHYVTARDAKFTTDMINNPQSDCAHLRSYYSDIEETTAVDDWTLVIRWKKTLFHSISFTLSLYIMPEFLYAYDEQGKRFPENTIGSSFNDHWFNRKGVCGSGPYMFVSFDPGQQVVLERFEDWYGIKAGLRYPLKRHRLFVFPDTNTNLLKLKAGEIRLTDNISAPQWKNEILENHDPSSPFNDGRIEHWIGKSANYLFFAWKNTHPLFKDKRVRKALALACNRDEIAHKIFLDRYRPMSSPVYPDSPEADPDLKPLPFDLDAARKLLDEAGWSLNRDTGLREKMVDGAKRSFEFTLNWPGPAPDFEAALNQYRGDLLSIGVKMNQQSMEWAAYQKKLKDREFEASSNVWTTNGWEHDFDQLWHSRGIQDPGSSNYIEFGNPEVDRLSDALRGEMDLGKRIEMVRRIGRVLYEEQPYCFFGWRNPFGANWSDLKNVQGSWYLLRPFLRTFPMYVAR